MAHGVKRIGRSFGETMLSIGALGALLTAIVLVDDRVREQVSMRFSGRTVSDELHSASVHAKEIAGVVMMAARDHGLEHGPVVLFAIAAVVLVVLMLTLRT
jgi:hypothetical protein